jgi:hypothetical protein
MEIDWTNATEHPEVELLNLGDLELDEKVTVEFVNVRETESGSIVADIRTDAGHNSIWLKGSYGAQNGLLSLLKAAGHGDKISGNSFVAEKIASDKSPAGYAFRWIKV